jgi:hypothetical protein
MTAKKWTPGPWSFDGVGAIRSAGGDFLAQVESLNAETLDEPTANGHLAAAAPDLYDALEAWEEWEKRHDGCEVDECVMGEGVSCAEDYHNNVLPRRESAMRKARGEAEAVARG